MGIVVVVADGATVPGVVPPGVDEGGGTVVVVVETVPYGPGGGVAGVGAVGVPRNSAITCWAWGCCT